MAEAYDERRTFPHDEKGGYAEVWHLAYPAVLTMISQSVMSFTDAVMVGRLGATQLAAVGLAGTLVWGLYSFFNGLVNGVNTFVAQAFGAKRYGEIGPISWQGVYLALASGALLCLASFWSTLFFRIMGPAQAVQEIGSPYLRIRLAGGVFMILWMCFSSFFRGLGDTMTPLKITVAANLANIGLNYVLIFGKLGVPRLEANGAAIATVIATGLGALAFFAAFTSRKNAERYATRTNRGLDWSSLARLTRVSAPIGVQWFLDMGSFILFSSLIGRIGTMELAATEATLRLMSLSFMPIVGISIASTTLVGQYIGSDERHLAVKSGYSSVRLGALYSFAIGLVFAIFPTQLVSLINSDPSVVRVGTTTLRLAALFQVFDGIGIVSNGCLRGAGDTKWAMYIGVGYAWLLFVPLAYVGGFVLQGGAVGAWIGATVYIMALGLTFFLRFRSGAWQRIKI